MQINNANKINSNIIINETYKQIERKLLNHEIYQNIKNYSKAKEKMKTYLEVGELLKDIDTKYGKM